MNALSTNVADYVHTRPLTKEGFREPYHTITSSVCTEH